MKMAIDRSLLERVREVAYKHALLNACKHGGKADLKAVVAKVIAEVPEVRGVVKEIVALVKEVVDEVNKMSAEDQLRVIKQNYPELLAEKHVEEEKKLQPLPNAIKGKVVTRFAPNPDYVLHLGNARPALLNYWYAKMYDGKFILRFEDTDPRTKAPFPEAYHRIKEDLKWLGVSWDEEYIQSLRLPKFYEVTYELIKRDGAYVDTCSGREFNKYKVAGKPCPHRLQSVDRNLEEMDRVLSGHYGEGEVVVRVKTDMNHPDPSVRDWVAFRVIDTSKTPHPLVGDKYILWPTYNFACGVDDYLMGVTHVLRAREHLSNTVKQKFLYNHMGWAYPEAIHFGRLSLEGFILSKSKMRDLVFKQGLKPYDDPRFGTISGLRKRGFVRETVWEVIRQVGVKPIDARISFVNLASINRSIIDPRARRFMAVDEPGVKLVFKLDRYVEASVIRNPSTGEKYVYRINPGLIEVLVSSRDVDLLRKTREVRLLGFVNVSVLEEKLMNNHVVLYGEATGFTHEEAVAKKLPIIQWVKPDESVHVDLVMCKGMDLQVVKLLGEKALQGVKVNDVVQLVRIGFVRVDEVSGSMVKTIFIHD